MGIKLYFLLGLLLISFTSAGYDFSIEQINKYDVTKNGSSVQDHNGLIYTFNDDGLITIQEENSTRHLGFAIEGLYNSNPIIRTTEDFTWNKSISQTDDNITGILDSGDGWIIKLIFFKDGRDVKIVHDITNNFPNNITETKLWYIVTIKENETFNYRDQQFTFEGNSKHNIGNFNSDAAKIYFDSGFTFNFEDLVDNDFDIIEYKIGDGSFVGYDDKNILALAVSKGDKVLESGKSLILDPTFVHQDESMIKYVKNNELWNETSNTTYEEYAFSVDIALKKLINGSFVINPENIFISQPDDDTFKFGAIDYNTYEDNIYQYTWESDQQIFEYKNDYFIGGEVKVINLFFTKIAKVIDTNKIDVSDICTSEASCNFSLSHSRHPSTYDEFGSEILGDVINSTLKVEFIGFYNSDTNSTFIDPAFSLTDSKWTTNIAALMNGTHISDGVIVQNIKDAVGIWHLDDNSSNQIDSSGNNNNGTVINATYTDSGKFGGAYDFNGVDDYIDIDAVINDLSSTTQGTWSAWINLSSSLTGNIIGVGDEDANTVILFRVQNSGKLDAIIYINGVAQWDVKTDDIVLTAGNWEQVTLVHDGTEPSLYVNGIKPAQSFSVTLDKTAWINNMSGLDKARIGDVNYAGTGESLFFNGTIDEPIIYTRALSAREIKDSYDANAPIRNNETTFSRVLELKTFEASNRSGLVGEWLFADGSATDTSGFGNDGVFYGGLTSCNGNGIGELYGQSCDFDGVDDTIKAPNQYQGNVFSVEAWVQIPPQPSYTGIVEFSNSNGDWQGLVLRNSGVICVVPNVAGSSLLYCGSPILDDGVEHYIVGGYDGVSTYLYVDNVYYSTSNTGTVGNVVANTVTLGGMLNLAIYDMEGKLMNVRIYNRTQSADEINTNYFGKPTSDQYIKNMSCEAGDSDKVLWAHFDQDVQSIADFSGEGNTGTRNGATYNNSCQIGGCFELDGVDDYIELGTSTTLNPEIMSIGSWINTNVTNGIIISKWDITGNDRSWLFRLNLGRIQFFLRDEDGVTLGNAISNTTVNNTGWNHVFGTFDGNEIKVYINGELDGITSFVGVIDESVSIARIGTSDDYSSFFNGSIDEPIIYPRALSPDEINASYQAGLQGLVYTGDVSDTTVRFRATNETPTYWTAKSVVLDIANNWGDGSFITIRSIEFYNNDSLISVTEVNSDFYATTEFNPVTHGVQLAFINTSKIGNSGGNAWVSASATTNQRLIAVFDTPQVLDTIVINNGHNSGTETDRGAQNVKIHVSSDAITSTVYNSAISNSELIYNDVFREHVALNIEDPENLTLDNATFNYVDGLTFGDWTSYQTCSLDQDLSSVLTDAATYVQYETLMSTTDVSYTAQLNFINFINDNESLNKAPVIIINSPINVSQSFNSTIFNFTVTDANGDNMTTWFYLDDSLNQTDTTVPNGTTVTIPRTLDVGNHTWYVIAGDGLNNATSETNWIFITTDTTAPNVTINSPINVSQSFNSTIFNFTVTDANGDNMTTWFYLDDSLNQTDTTVPNGTTVTIPRTLADGNHTWYVIANNGLNNATSETNWILITTGVSDNILEICDSNTGNCVTNFTKDGDGILSGSITTKNITLGSGVIIGWNSTCPYILYNSTGGVIDTKGC